MFQDIVSECVHYFVIPLFIFKFYFHPLRSPGIQPGPFCNELSALQMAIRNVFCFIYVGRKCDIGA